MKWAQWKYPGTGDLSDIYQQAFTIFYYNVKDGKFTGLNSSSKTYLFGIGKNLLNKKIENARADESLDEIPEIELPTENIFDQYENSHRSQLVRSILNKIGEPCKSILTKYYFDNFTMEAIAENLGYKTAMVAKKKKCECLVKIRKALHESSVRQNMEQSYEG